jgi:NADH-quinone oxidoreductase subunit J
MHVLHIVHVMPAAFPPVVSSLSNVNQLGNLLYTHYVLPFEIAAVILLVAMIAAISLTLYEPIQRKQQSVEKQIKVKREDRVRLVK